MTQEGKAISPVLTSACAIGCSWRRSAGCPTSDGRRCASGDHNRGLQPERPPGCLCRQSRPIRQPSTKSTTTQRYRDCWRSRWSSAARRNASRRRFRVRASRSARPWSWATGSQVAMSVGVVSSATRSQYPTASAARPLLPPAVQDLGRGGQAEHDRRVAAQRAQIDAGMAHPRRIPVHHAHTGLAGPQCVALPQVAVDEHAHPLRHRQHVQPLLGGIQQRRRAADPPLRREIHVTQRPHPQRQVGTRRGCHRVQRGRGSTRRPQPHHRRDGGDRAAARQDRHQQGRPPSGIPIKVDGQQPWSRQPVLFGQRQGCRLGGKPPAATDVGVADTQDRLDRLAAMVDAEPPGPRASPHSLDRHDPGARAHLVGGPPQNRLNRHRHTQSLTERTISPDARHSGYTTVEYAAIPVFQPESASAGAPLRGVPTALRPPRDRPQPRAAAGHRDRGRNRSRPTYRLLVVRALAGADSGLTALLTDAVQRLANEVAGWGHHDAAGQVGARQLECGHLVAGRAPALHQVQRVGGPSPRAAREPTARPHRGAHLVAGGMATTGP